MFSEAGFDGGLCQNLVGNFGASWFASCLGEGGGVGEVDEGVPELGETLRGDNCSEIVVYLPQLQPSRQPGSSHEADDSKADACASKSVENCQEFVSRTRQVHCSVESFEESGSDLFVLNIDTSLL